MEHELPLPQKKGFRFNTFLEIFIQWLQRYLLTKIADWLARKFGPRLIKALKSALTKNNLKRLSGVLWKVSPVMTISLGFVFQQNVLWFASRLSLPWMVAIVAPFGIARLYFGLMAKRHLDGFKTAILSAG